MNKTARVLLFSLMIIFGLLMLRIMLFYSGTEKNSSATFKKVFRENYRIFSPVLPGEIEFAGERVPLHLIHIREKLDREILVNTYWHSATLLMFKRSQRYFPMIEKILREQGIPDDFKYLGLIESSFTHAVSPSGAAGFWQFMAGTGKEYGLEINEFVDERYHIAKSTVAACDYLREAYERYRNWSLVAASYNAGMKRISDALEKQKTGNYYDLFLNEETSRYIFRVLAIKAIVENPLDYGIYLRETDLYPEIPVRQVGVDSTVENLVDFAAEQGSNYLILKTFNPWLRSDKLPVREGASYVVEFPESLEYEVLSKFLDEESIRGDSVTLHGLSD
ncbi:MAG: lytic transglycosylase domain-containing protein [Bacteroidales bacterium]|nr:lytic transglycosylase domain-containing protein [Bacteroidales bacterium]